MKKIAVIGAGISGNAAAWALSKHYDVTLIEKDQRIGGHSHTVDVDYDGKRIAVDTGFIVYNEHNYPLLTQLFDHLGVETKLSNMSFGVSLDSGRLEWSGQGLSSVFAQRRNLFSPGFLLMLREIFRFNKICKDDLATGRLCDSSFADYLRSRKFSERLREDYLVPMTAAIWSSPPKQVLEFPAESLMRFLDNHRLIHKREERPKWRTVAGGSRQYVDKLMGDFDGVTLAGRAVERIENGVQGPVVVFGDGARIAFDEVVIAAHSDQALRMLDTPSAVQRSILSAIPYKPNTVYLHRDPALMPKRRAVWSAWNYLGSRKDSDTRDLSVTYWMNRLQGIDEKYPLFVSLNPIEPPKRDLTFEIFRYDHPLFDRAAVEAQKRLPSAQGENGIWFAGAWTRYGFHEDGLASGLNVARALGATIPFEHGAATADPHAQAAREPIMQAAE